MNPPFTVIQRDSKSKAKLGVLRTRRGVVQTPLFCPVGTAATVKAMTPAELAEMGVQMILCNSYHLYLRPGHERIARLGGLHRFMGWRRPILTDSGGYQIRSLSTLCAIADDGVSFRSHIDGSLHFFTPELAIGVQLALGADIVTVFDECLSYPSGEEATAVSLERTRRWAERSKAAFERSPSHEERPLLFGIVQGGVYPELRRRSVEELQEIGFAGYAVGGLSVGEPTALMLEILDGVTDHLPKERPCYLMGVGRPEDLVEGVSRGVDLFDCVMPTRHGRTGELFTRSGKIAIKQACYQEDERPLDEGCACFTCGNFSRAYLRHLFLSHEILGIRLNTLHNLFYYTELMQQIRGSLKEGTFLKFRDRFYELRREANDGMA